MQRLGLIDEKDMLLSETWTTMLAPRTVFNQAHHQAVAFFGLNDNGWDLGLTELDERFDSTLATNKIIACRVRLALSRANRDRALEPDIGNALYNLLKIAPISESARRPSPQL